MGLLDLLLLHPRGTVSSYPELPDSRNNKKRIQSDMKNHTKPKAFLLSGVSSSPHPKYARLTCGSKYSLETKKRKLRVYKFFKNLATISKFKAPEG